MKLIIMVVCMAMVYPAWATPQRQVNWEQDGFSSIGKFMGGAAYGVVNGADVTPRTKKEQITGAAIHLSMSTAMITISPIGGIAYLTLSAIISGIGRVAHKEVK